MGRIAETVRWGGARMARVFTFLVVDSPGQSQQIIIWDTLEVTVGRGPDRDLVIPDSEVSRQHALFAMDGASHIVADLHTSNGTYVNGARVSRHQLRPGDVVELGPARIQFRQETESPKGKNVRFASQLKSGFNKFGDDDDAGNRTVMGMPGGLVGAQGDYSDRVPQGEAEFDLGGGTGNTPAAVVDLDSVLDGNLDAVQIASFEDEELTNLEKDLDEPPVPPRARPAPPPPPREARPAPQQRPVQRAAAPPQPAPAPRAAAPVAAAPRAAAPAAAETSSSDTTARATLSIEIEGPRAVLKAVVANLLDREISIPPLKIRLRRPS
jgi:predicted component of type VI protein secretion system